MAVIEADTGSVVVTQSELVDLHVEPWDSYEAALARLLQGKGVPIDGVFFPRMRPGIQYVRARDPMTGDMTVSWRPAPPFRSVA
jgi:hypothetical protein